MVICLFGLSSMLIDMRVYTECTPGIPGYEKIPEPGLSLDLILEPNLEILPLYSWFIFHIIFRFSQMNHNCKGRVGTYCNQVPVCLLGSRQYQ